VSEDDLRAIAKRGYEGAVTTDHDHACIVVPQFVVAAMSPWVGAQARLWGRRPLLIVGFAALPIRGLLFATMTNPSLIVVVQILDGVTAAVFAVMVPLIIADLTRGTGHFNLGQGIVGTATSIPTTSDTKRSRCTSEMRVPR
jgi:MFS family permease